MDWYSLIEKAIGTKFSQDLTLVILVIFTLRSHVKKVEVSVEGINKGLFDLKGVFREHNKRLGNVEGTVEAIKYEVFELQQDVKILKKE